MTKGINIRELILGILLEIQQNDRQYAHILLRDVLEKYQYLDQQERAFIKRVTEGTIENRILLDYIIDQFSKTKTAKMKPVILCILRMSVYQLFFMDSVPASAVCNEAVKLAEKKHFHNLKGFVNGVLRNIERSKAQIQYPDAKEQPKQYLSVTYSMPEWIVEKWMTEYGFDMTEKMLQSFLQSSRTTIRCNQSRVSPAELEQQLEQEHVKVTRLLYPEGAYEISGYDHLGALQSFRQGLFQVQDVSSMLIGEIAGVKPESHVIDVCAAPGGKAICIADQLQGTGHVAARDLSENKTQFIKDNIERCQLHNIEAVVQDALVHDEASIEKADILIADLPCSGLGVIGRKSDIKYHLSEQQLGELAALQREILGTVQDYVKPGGILIYSTCTVNQEENVDNLMWFVNHYAYQLDSIDSYLPEELHSETTRQGYLQLLPGEHDTDGFFMARLIRNK
ncbi:MAG: 16S rRNA (cytosine(967)-C(5))-methyltransferase RsmB [bacterium]|nr:16S rRNA (cytosine(967)-C(5))-methyltransferase RsmB [bacterium]